MDKDIISIPIRDNRHLVAQIGVDKDYKEIFVYITDDEGYDVREIGVIRPSYHYDKNGHVITEETYEVLVRDEDDTDYDDAIVLSDPIEEGDE